MGDSNIERWIKDLRQVVKARDKLGDQHSPVDQIKKPSGMRTKVFDTTINRIKKYENRVIASGPRAFNPKWKEEKKNED